MAEEVCKGEKRDIEARWARLSLHCNPLRAIILGREPNNNKIQNWFSCKVFSKGVYPKYLVQCVLWFMFFNDSANLFLSNLVVILFSEINFFVIDTIITNKGRLATKL
jgi:hypothetical protein